MLRHDEQVQEVEVSITSSAERVRAICYPALTGPVQIGSRVTLNTTAQSLGLGTGGHHFVTAVANTRRNLQGPGHIMKLRYTPNQLRVLAVEEPDSPHHDVIRDFTSLKGMPVVVATLHSLVPAILFGCKVFEGIRVAYVMTDGAALPAYYSRNLQAIRRDEAFCGVITVGHAFGGDLEAVTPYAALAAAAAVLRADVTIVAMGPGIVGTATPWGTTALEQAPWIDAVAALAGVPIGVVRLSFGDPRSRHFGMSHHSRTVLGRLTHTTATVPLPYLHGWRRRLVLQQLESMEGLRKHKWVWEACDHALPGLVTWANGKGINLTTMGRTAHQDPYPFLAGVAAGRVAGRLAMQAT